MIRAILWAQWRTMRLAGRGQWWSWVSALVWYGLWTGAAFAAAISARELDAAAMRLYLPVSLLAICLYWQVMPIVSASLGAGLDLRKLRLYPVPHRQLFLIEVLLRLTSSVEMLLVLSGGALGLLANPVYDKRAALPMIALAALLVAFNLLLSAGTRYALERVLARRHVREVAVLVMAMLWVAPRLLYSMGLGRGSVTKLGRAMQTVAFPWTAAARGAMGEDLLRSFGSLGLWTAAAWWFGRLQFERSFRFDAGAAQAAGAEAANWRAVLAERLFRLPSRLWRDPLGAIVEKELRSLARTPRFRSIFIMGFTFGLAVWFPLIARQRDPSEDHSWFVTLVCVYALTLLGQVSYWNCFGLDRSAVAFYFAAPLPIGSVLAGKNVAALIFIYLEVVAVVGATAVFRISGGWVQSLETLLVVGVCALYLLALGNWASVRYPRSLSGERVGQGGGRGFQGFLFLIYPITLTPVGLAYLARYAFESELIFLLALAIAGIVGGVFYWVAMDSAVRTAALERERIILELSQNDGPVAE